MSLLDEISDHVKVGDVNIMNNVCHDDVKVGDVISVNGIYHKVAHILKDGNVIARSLAYVRAEWFDDGDDFGWRVI